VTTRPITMHRCLAWSVGVLAASSSEDLSWRSPKFRNRLNRSRVPCGAGVPSSKQLLPAEVQQIPQFARPFSIDPESSPRASRVARERERCPRRHARDCSRQAAAAAAGQLGTLAVKDRYFSRHGSQPVAEARSVSGGGARLLAGTCHDALHSSHAAARYTLSVPPDTTALHMLREEA
jgi:hypothetical protein